MQTNAHPWILAGQFNGFFEAGLIHHQTAGSKNAFLMGANDRVVRARVESKIVGIDNQPPFHFPGYSHVNKR
jgi:hypothetical protein